MSIFKDTFIPAVQKQLDARQKAVKKRSPQAIQYLNTRNAWIRMTSSVNIIGTDGKSSNSLANAYKLQGGTLSGNTPRAGVGNTSNTAYSAINPGGTANARGIRPMPGIVDVNIRSKSAYGSLREIVINFQCWDITQLEDLELLYMRPGYTVLVEWGWLPYLETENSLQNNIQTFDIIDQIIPKEKIWEQLFKKSKATGGNYDAMFGYVKNYSWSARPDGGYDCSTTIISIGEVIESLKINYAPSTLKLEGRKQGLIFANVTKAVIDRYKKNILAGLFAELYEKVKAFNNNANEKGNTFVLQNYDFFIRKSEIKNSEDNDPQKLVGADSNKTQIYITLKSLINVLNKYVILSDTKNSVPITEFSLTERIYDKNPPVEKDLLCLAHPLQISVDPTICLIGNNLWSNIKAPTIPPTNTATTATTAVGTFLSTVSSLGIGGAAAVATAVSTAPSTAEIISNSIEGAKYLANLKPFFYGTPEDELGVIGNIYINLQFLYGLSLDNNLESQDKKEKQEIAIYDFVKNILSQVSNSIGNVNNFDIHVDPIDNKARIIDINYVDNAKKDEVFNNAFTLEMHNLSSTVRSYKLESQIFPEQSTIVAIGAQVQGGALGTDSNTMAGFNRNITDRIIPAKTDPTVTQEENIQSTRKRELDNLKENLSTIYKFFGDTSSEYIFWSQAAYDANSSGQYKGALKDLIANFKSLTKSRSKYNAIIPTKLSLEMDGIGGLVIGHIFKIPTDLLPKGYKGGGLGSKLGQIITGIGHKISGNDWTTNIDAQTIVLDDPTEGEDVDYKSLLEIVSKAYAEGKDLNDIIGSGTDGISPNEIIRNEYEPSLAKVNTTEGLKVLMEAHSIIEGFYPSSRAYRNNNPGNISYSNNLKIYGAVLEPKNSKGERRFAKFPTLQKGLEAKADYINRIIAGEHSQYPKNPSLSVYMNKYAPPNENDTIGYIKKIIGYFAKKGAVITGNTKLSEIRDIKFTSKSYNPFQSNTTFGTNISTIPNNPFPLLKNK